MIAGIDIATLVFYLFAIVAALTAAGMVFATDPVHSAVFLVISFLNVAGLYVMLGAEFLAAVQVIVYTGAILVLFLFVLFLVRPQDLRELHTAPRTQTILAWILGLALFFEIVTVISTGVLAGQRGQWTPEQVAMAGGNTQALGRLLYSDFMLPFVLLSLILLVAMIAAVYLGLPEQLVRGDHFVSSISLARMARAEQQATIGAPAAAGHDAAREEEEAEPVPVGAGPAAERGGD